MSSSSSQAKTSPRTYISPSGAITNRPSLLRQIEDFLYAVWEYVVLFFKSFVDVSSPARTSLVFLLCSG